MSYLQLRGYSSNSILLLRRAAVTGIGNFGSLRRRKFSVGDAEGS